MSLAIRAVALWFIFCSAGASLSQTALPLTPDNKADTSLQALFSDFNITAASESADRLLRRAPHDVMALFVRMETAEIEERPELVLDSALRLCSLHAPPELHELASNRVLQRAANSWAFNTVLRRIKWAASLNNDCTFNLRLALVAAATDGASVDLDQAAHSSGLITHWRIVGPFGKYNNVDFEHDWPPESAASFRSQYINEQPPRNEDKGRATDTADPSRGIAPERFWFRDGMISLPEYLSSAGVYYGAGYIEVAPGLSRIDVLSSASYEVFIDGKPVLLHDARYAAGANRDSASPHLAAGQHRVLIKFTGDAVPLSVAVHPQFASRARTKSSMPPSIAGYTQAALAYFRSDLTGMQNALLNDRVRNLGYSQYLRALLYSAAEDHSPRADAAWKALATAQPTALLARLRRAESATERGQSDAVRADVMSVLAERPQSETALQLAFNLSRRNQAEAPALLSRLLELHPSCTRLADAVKFYNSTAEQDTARKIEQQLASCAPESLSYARLLAESGRHSAAAAYLQQLVVRNPLHRTARRFLIEQLLLDNQLSAAKLQARQLKDIALNARADSHLADSPGPAQDSHSERADGFVTNSEFYVPYRRDGIDIVRKSAQRSFSGGAAVVLLSDKTVVFRREGQVSVYVHRITRPINKEGISRYGEVTVPRGADLLELRTIKADGEIIEPELTQQKPTISMPALEAGDAIEEEYVTHYSDLDQMPEGAGSHTFGSFAAPILHSRLVLLNPPDASVRIREHANPPLPLVGENNGLVIRIWERDNIQQTIAESFLPPVNLLPTVTIAPPDKTSARLRDELIDASRIGLHANEIAAELHLSPNAAETEKAKRLYRFVTGKIDSTGPDWAASPAEDTLANGQGIRTMALLALARATGLKAGLVLARKIDQGCGRERDFSCFTEPLVRFWLANGDPVDVDAESDDLPFGDIPPSLDVREAHLVPLLPEDEKKTETVSLISRLSYEKSFAEADITFQEADLIAHIEVELGAVRAQEVRSMLRNSGERERQAFFEQLAMRIFPGATSVTGIAAHENDPEQPLKLSVHCVVPQFVNRQSSRSEVNQLAPALGLAGLYARTPSRKFPLYIDSLFFESTVFHLHLATGMEIRALPADFADKAEFGEYTLRFVRLAHQIDIHRDFHIPVQVIAPEKYPAFVTFAMRIDDAERQRIFLDTMKDQTMGRNDGEQPVAQKR